MINTANKLIQALNYIASKQIGKSVGFKKAYKLLWLIDRYSLRHYARTVSGDRYYAMQLGPVPTDAKHLLERVPTNIDISECDVEDYILINDKEHRFRSRKSPDLSVFSVSDIKVMDLILEKYGKMKSNDLSAMSHRFPEWTPYKERLEKEGGKKSFPINPKYFFEVYDDGKGVFNEDPQMLEIAKDMYNEYNSAN